MISTSISKVKNAKAFIILAHGAGADKDSEYLFNLSTLLNQSGFTVLRFNFPYMDKRKLDGKRRPPDRIQALLSCFVQIIASVDTKLPIYLIGKSMGGRVAATLASNDALISQYNIKGVACIGYPFHPIKKADKLRLAPLQETKLPILILQGDRDALGNQAEIAHYTISKSCRVSFFQDGDHDLKPRVKSGYTLKQHQTRAITEIEEFINESK